MNVQDVPRDDTSRDGQRDGDYASVALIGEAAALLAKRLYQMPASTGWVAALERIVSLRIEEGDHERPRCTPRRYPP